MTTELQTTGGIDLSKAIETAAGLGTEGVEVIERLQVIIKDERDHRAELDFNAAMTALHRNLKPIHKNQKGEITTRGGGKFTYRYADLAQIEKALRDADAFGLGFSWFFDSVYHEGDGMAVCVLSHESGHVRRSHFPIEPDKRENRATSVSQGIRASTSYADRATLQRAFGITHLTEDDTDGRAEMPAQSAPVVTAEQAMTLEARCQEVAEATGKDAATVIKGTLTWAGADSFETFPAHRYDAAIEKLGARLK